MTRIMNNKKEQIHLCAQCAREQGELNFEPFSVQSLLAGLLGSGFVYPAFEQKPKPESQPICQNCGTSFADFTHTGRLGCAQCYETFREALNPLLRRIHGSVYHTGKVPRCLGRQVHTRRGLAELQEQLQRFIEREEYEQAAVIRDKIRELKRELSGGDDSEHQKDFA
jgi:protein arginine kinase activator